MIVDVHYPVPVPAKVTLTMTFLEARDLYETLSILNGRTVVSPLPEPLYRVFYALVRSSVPRKVGEQ